MSYCVLWWKRNQVFLSRCAIITVTSKWAWWRIKSPVSRLFAKQAIRAEIKENIKVTHNWSLWGEFTGDRWIPRTKASNAENVSIWWRHHDGTPLCGWPISILITSWKSIHPFIHNAVMLLKMTDKGQNRDKNITSKAKQNLTPHVNGQLGISSF